MRIRKDNEISTDETLNYIATVSDALAHPARLELLRYIMQCNKTMKNVCNSDLVDKFDYAQATVSQHMKKLTQAGLVTSRRKDKFAYYYANVGLLMKYIDMTKKFANS